MARYDNDNIKKLESLPILGDKPSSEKEEKFLREISEYIFQNLETPNLSVSFAYGDTKNGVNLMLMHGGKYRFPRFLARHIENASKPIYDMKPDTDGVLRIKETGRQPRFQMRQDYSKA